MKRLFLYLMAGVSLFATGCFGSDDDSDLSKVYTGLVMLNNVEQTNKYAYDGLNVAVRLAILLNEMQSVGLEFVGSSEPDWSELGDVVYLGLPYNKKTFLFGNTSSVSISKDGDKYYIKYGTSNGQHTAGYGDVTYRIGTYCIDTSGHPNIFDSDASSKWSVSIDGDSMTYALNKNSTLVTFEALTLDLDLWGTSYNSFDYTIPNYAVELIIDEDDDDYDEDTQYISDWSLSGSVEIPELTGLSIEDTYKTNFEMSAAGNGTVVAQDDYDYYTSSPLIYNFLAGANYKYGGIEEIEYLGTSSLSSNFVTVDILSNGIQVIYYNGYSYEYDSEAYYYYYYDDVNDAEDDAEDEDEDEDDD